MHRSCESILWIERPSSPRHIVVSSICYISLKCIGVVQLIVRLWSKVIQRYFDVVLVSLTLLVVFNAFVIVLGVDHLRVEILLYKLHEIDVADLPSIVFRWLRGAVDHRVDHVGVGVYAVCVSGRFECAAWCALSHFRFCFVALHPVLEHLTDLFDGGAVEIFFILPHCQLKRVFQIFCLVDRQAILNRVPHIRHESFPYLVGGIVATVDYQPPASVLMVLNVFFNVSKWTSEGVVCASVFFQSIPNQGYCHVASRSTDALLQFI
jgi:hypothetical protein